MTNTFVTPLWLQRDGVRLYFQSLGILTPKLADIIDKADQHKLNQFFSAIARANGDIENEDD